jgi:D-alanine-D-alanine ligase
MGGFSVERDVSLISGKAVLNSLKELGHEVVVIDPNPDMKTFISQIMDTKADVIFNALHGRYGEDGRIQSVLDLLKIPYTHSGVLASSLAMDKVLAKKFFQGIGIPVAKGLVAHFSDIQKGHVMPPPYVIKPICDGSSIGVSIIQTDEELRMWKHDAVFGDEYLIEEYIPGRELHVGIVGGNAVGVIELIPHKGFYDYETKYTDGLCTHVLPAQIPQDIYDFLMKSTQNLFANLKARGIARADWRWDEKSPSPILLEINTHPGFTPISTLPEIALFAGISFNQVVQILIETAHYDH